ncbi:hypothetical protein AOQ84DRAFT_442811 [Glonium stellatum]|uniref:Uncharacterized protein n=1 Tax=Glonium stellatum TaxID=574774 RepID=A0A8E2ERK0_9PEZI|nr:hypothetical protein AOQ84DRAFT_442811 [Glonium stellatum]
MDSLYVCSHGGKPLNPQTPWLATLENRQTEIDVCCALIRLGADPTLWSPIVPSPHLIILDMQPSEASLGVWGFTPIKEKRLHAAQQLPMVMPQWCKEQGWGRVVLIAGALLQGARRATGWGSRMGGGQNGEGGASGPACGCWAIDWASVGICWKIWWAAGRLGS